MHARALESPPLPRPMPAAKTDALSVEELVRAQFAFVWRTLRRLGLSGADADDGVQQVFIVLARRLHEIEAGRERAFLFGTAVKVASRTRRSINRRREVDGTEFDELQSQLPGPETALDQRRAVELLDAVLSKLDEDLRAVFILHELSHLTMTEIASALQIPQGTVASRLRRAREQFNRRLSAVQRLRKAEVDGT